ncbi:MAG: hypothetical protein WC836_21945 [Desulfobacula sp.]|jgi:hypothetical protein
MDMNNFKVHGFGVFQRDNRTYYIELIRDELIRNQWRSLKTKDAGVAKDRAELSVEKYFQKKIISIKKGNSKTLSEYLKNFLDDKSFNAWGSDRLINSVPNFNSSPHIGSIIKYHLFNMPF